MLIQEVCNELGVVIVAIECDKDHVHLFLNTLPTLSPADTMAKIKGVTSKNQEMNFFTFNTCQVCGRVPILFLLLGMYQVKQ